MMSTDSRLDVIELTLHVVTLFLRKVQLWGPIVSISDKF